jgi:acetoin utilization deacetylase AcuC-like enzyme
MKEFVLFYSQGHAAHFEPGHPERPERLEVIQAAFKRRGIWEAFPPIEPEVVSSNLLSRVHTPAYLDHLQDACRQGLHLDMDTYTTPASWHLAMEAAGGAVAVAQEVWTGKAARGLALTRPPGHHATPGRGMGFCLLNNMAIAAESLIHPQQPGVSPADRLAIVDLDLHHGNGTQEVFYLRNDVLYISTHQSPFYPGSGYVDEIGEGAGEGFTANFPLPSGTGDRGFLTTLNELIIPLLDGFYPQMILVSVGYDPHWRDPLGSLLLSASGFYQLIAGLTRWADGQCQGKIALVLEGGYDLQAGEACALAWVGALLSQPCEDAIGPAPNAESLQWKVMLNAAHQIWDSRLAGRDF